MGKKSTHWPSPAAGHRQSNAHRDVGRKTVPSRGNRKARGMWRVSENRGTALTPTYCSWPGLTGERAGAGSGMKAGSLGEDPCSLGTAQQEDRAGPFQSGVEGLQGMWVASGAPEGALNPTATSLHACPSTLDSRVRAR